MALTALAASSLIAALGVVGLLAPARLATPFFGLDRLRRLLDWWSELEPALIRVWSFFVVSFGLALAYAWT